MSSAIDVASEGDEDGPSDPYEGERIEISEAELRKVSPAAWLGGLKRKVDDVATRLTYGR